TRRACRSGPAASSAQRTPRRAAPVAGRRRPWWNPAVETEVSAVRAALYRGDRETANALVRDGADVNVFDAAALGDVDRLRAHLAADPQLGHAWSADGFTALHFAAYLGGAPAVRELLAAGSDAQAVSRNDMRVQPLHSAAALGDVEACRALLDA